jgi:hypothetical protein
VKNRAEVFNYGLHDNVGQLRRHFSYMLETYGEMKAADYPEPRWKIFDHYDKETFFSRDAARSCARRVHHVQKTPLTPMPFTGNC